MSYINPTYETPIEVKMARLDKVTSIALRKFCHTRRKEDLQEYEKWRQIQREHLQEYHFLKSPVPRMSDEEYTNLTIY